MILLTGYPYDNQLVEIIAVLNNLEDGWDFPEKVEDQDIVLNEMGGSGHLAFSNFVGPCEGQRSASIIKTSQKIC